MDTPDFERDLIRASRIFEIERLKAEEHRLTCLLADAVKLAADVSGVDAFILLELLAAQRRFNLKQAAILDDLEQACDDAQGADDFLHAYDRLERTRERMSGRRRVT